MMLDAHWELVDSAEEKEIDAATDALNGAGSDYACSSDTGLDCGADGPPRAGSQDIAAPGSGPRNLRLRIWLSIPSM